MVFRTAAGVTGSVVISQVSPGRKNKLSIEVAGATATLGFDQEQPESCFAQLQITDGAFETIFGEPGKPFLCFPDDAEELPEPEPRS